MSWNKFLIISIYLSGFVNVSVNSNWWYLSQFDRNSVRDPRILCKVVPHLHKKQQELCRAHSELVLVLGESIREAILECQYQFRFSRWNCTTFQRDFSVFGKNLVRGGTRELAFLQAIITANAILKLLRECSSSSGVVPCGCSLDSKLPTELPMARLNSFNSNPGLHWVGCPETLEFVMDFVNNFSDGRSLLLRDTKAKMTQHNNRAGRQAFLMSSGTRCKCHGISGSCTLRTCWATIPKLKNIGNSLKRRYDEAIKVTLNPGGRLVPLNKRQRRPGRAHLVYYEDSSNSCSVDLSRGLIGTGNRICNESLDAPDSCDILCCGNGFEPHRIPVTYQCHCVFVWCCQVHCSVCHEWRLEPRCKTAPEPQFPIKPPNNNLEFSDNTFRKWFPVMKPQEIDKQKW